MRVLVALLCLSGTAYAGEASLFWEIPALREDGSALTNLAGFNVYYGCGAEQNYPHKVSGLPPTQTTLDLTGLPEGVLCRFVATAYDSDNRESRYSGEATKLIDGEVPGSITRLSVVATESGPVQMALSTVGTAATYDNGGSLWGAQALPTPSGTASGDVMVIALAYYENLTDGAPDAISGFTQRAGFVYSGSGTTESLFYIWTRDCDGTEAASYTVGRSAANIFGSAIMVTFRGSATLTYNSIGTTNTASSATSITANSVSGTDGQGLLAFYALSDPGSSHSQTEGMTLAVASPDNTNNDRIYYETLSATGATGTRELTWTTSRDAGAVLMLLDGAAAGGGGGRIMGALGGQGGLAGMGGLAGVGGGLAN